MDWAVTGGSSGNLTAGGTTTGTATYTGAAYGLRLIQLSGPPSPASHRRYITTSV